MSKVTWIESLKKIKQNFSDIYDIVLSGDTRPDYNLGFAACARNVKLDIYKSDIPDEQFMGNQTMLIAVANTPLLSIGESAFAECKNLYLIIPDMDGHNYIKSIGNYAFAGCENLRHIRLNSVETIGDCAFKGCNGLLSFSLSDKLSKISDSAFDEVELPFKKDDIGYYIPDQNGNPCGYIKGINSEIENLEIDNVFIYKNSFENFKNLKTIKLSSNLKMIGHNAFSGCDNVEEIEIPFLSTTPYPMSYEIVCFGKIFGANTYDDHKKIFGVTSKLKTIKLTGGNIIWENSFRNCKYVEKIILPDTLNIIQREGFRDCNYLGSTLKNGTRVYDSENPFTIPKNVESINCFSFYRCNYLQAIEVAEDNEFFFSEDGIVYSADGKTLVAFPPGYFFDYARDDAVHGKGVNGYTIKDGVECIGDGAFNACRDVARISIGKDVKTIGYHAFKDCSRLSRILVNDWNEHFFSEDGVLYKGKQYSTAGKTLFIYPYNKHCGQNDVNGTFTVPYYTIAIEDGAFGTLRLDTIRIRADVKEIGHHAFSGCLNLQTIEFECSEEESPPGRPWGAPSATKILYKRKFNF